MANGSSFVNFHKQEDDKIKGIPKEMDAKNAVQ